MAQKSILTTFDMGAASLVIHNLSLGLSLLKLVEKELFSSRNVNFVDSDVQNFSIPFVIFLKLPI